MGVWKERKKDESMEGRKKGKCIEGRKERKEEVWKKGGMEKV